MDPVVSCRILPYPAVSCRICRILPYPAVSCRILRILPYSAVSCRILPYPAVSCRILPYPAVSCRILPYPAVSCRILPYPAVSNTRNRETLLGNNLEGACSIFLQKSLILVRHIYWIFRLLRGGWLGCTRAFVKWHLSPYPLKFSLWSTATTHPHCHCTPRHPRARALARLVSSSQGTAGLAWHGMVWLGVRARCFHNEVW